MWLPVAAQAPISPTGEPVQAKGMRVQPLGSAADQKIPASELNAWEWDQKSMEWEVAGKLGFAIGDAEAGVRSKVIVAEFSRSKTVQSNGSRVRYGVAARLIVEVRDFKLDANLTLPFVAAEAQLGKLQASANLKVEGYAGADLAKSFPAFSSFDVETYVKLLDALTKLKDMLGSNEDKLDPVQLWAWAETDEDTETASPSSALAAVWALTRLARGDPFERALAGYADRHDAGAQAAMQAVYGKIQGEVSSNAPGDVARAEAAELLSGYELHRPRARDMVS